MKYIANILTPKQFADSELYNVVNDKKDLIDGIPTLVIGWEFAKSNYDGLNILEWQIDDDTYWTFGKREKNQVYETRVPAFRKIAVTRFVKSIKYDFVNVLTATKEEKAQLFKAIRECDDLTVYVNNNMVYIYTPCEKRVVGFSLNDVEYGGGDKKRIFSCLHRNEGVSLIESKDGLSVDMKNTFMRYNYVIPYLFSND